MACKRRKVDVENRTFNSNWTELYIFTEDIQNNRPQCLICQGTVAVHKAANIKRHHDTKHADFVQTFPLGTTKRTVKIARLMDGIKQQVAGLVKFTTVQKKSTAASLKVSCVLAKAMAPYSFGPVVKECLKVATETLFPENKEMQAAMQDISLSRKTVTTRIEDISKVVFTDLIRDIKDSDGYSLALDESTDNIDIAQLAIFVRFFNRQTSRFIEQLLTIIPLKAHTTGEVIFDRLMTFLNDHDLSVEKIVSVSTDGAPAMSGTENGLAGRLSRVNPRIIFLHCIIHQAVLCAKLSGIKTHAVTKIVKLNC